MKHKSHLGFVEKVGFAFGDAASNLFFQTFGIFLLFYYTDIVGLSATTVGTMFLVVRIMDTLTDPVMGLIADRTNTRWGKFRFWILVGAVPYGLIGFLMFVGPDFNTTGRLIYAYVTYSLMMLAYTLVNVPYSSLMGVMTPSIQERSVLSSYRFVFAFGAGIIVSAAFIPLKDLLGGGDELLGVRYTMAIFAVISVAMFMITVLTTRERVHPPVNQKTTLKQDIKDLLQNWPWIMVSLITVLQLIAIVVRESSIIFYFKYVIGSELGASSFIMWAKIAIIAGIVGNVYAMRLFDKRSLLIAYCYVAAVLYGGIYFIDPGNTFLLYAMNIGGSLAFGPIGVILWSMYGDCADYGEWKFGRRATALVFSSSLFAIKFGLAMGGAIPGWLLGSTGFIANEAQGEATLRMMTALMTVIPAGIVCIFGTLVFAYSLNNRKLEQIESDLAARGDV